MSHADAVLTLLEAVDNLTVYDGDVPDLPSLPYVVLWIAEPLRTAGRLSGEQDDAQSTFQTSSVGSTPEQARWAQAKVHEALLNRRPVITGRSSTRVKHDSAPPVRADYDVDPTVFTAVDLWSAYTTPA